MTWMVFRRRWWQLLGQHLPTHSTASEKRSLMHWHHPLGGEVLGQAANSQPNVSPCKLNLFHGRRPKWVRQICPLWHATNAWVRYSWRPRLNKWKCHNSLARSVGKFLPVPQTQAYFAGPGWDDQVQQTSIKNTGGVLLKLPKRQESWEILFIAQTCTRTTCVSMSSSLAGVKDS